MRLQLTSGVGPREEFATFNPFPAGGYKIRVD